MKNLFEYLISATLAILVLVFLYTTLKVELIEVASKAFAPFTR